MKMIWAGDTDTVDIVRGAPEYIGLFNVLSNGERHAVARSWSLAHRNMFNEHGEYIFKIVVSAKNAQPKEYEIVGTLTDDWTTALFIPRHESCTKVGRPADFDRPDPIGAGTSPSGSRTERANLRVETLISIWFMAHLPSQSSATAASQLGRACSLPSSEARLVEVHKAGVPNELSSMKMIWAGDTDTVDIVRGAPEYIGLFNVLRMEKGTL